jgi:hypothetical protein
VVLSKVLSVTQQVQDEDLFFRVVPVVARKAVLQPMFSDQRTEELVYGRFVGDRGCAAGSNPLLE